MNLLIVEDEVANIATILEGMNRICAERDLPIISVEVASTQEEALAAIRTNVFDLIVLDLKIPTKKNALDEDEKNGEQVFAEARNLLPNVPICLFSAFPTQSILRAALDASTRIDIWGEGTPRPIITSEYKTQMDKLIDYIIYAHQAIHELESIDINIGPMPPETISGFRRILKIFTRINHGDAVLVKSLGNGLSSSRVLELKITNRGQFRCMAVAKLGPIDDIKMESRNYSHEATRLRNMPYKLAIIAWGNVNNAGLFYSLADDTISAFEFAQNNRSKESAVTFFGKLKQNLDGWRVIAETEKKIEDIRRLLLSDADYEEIKNNYPTLNLAEIDESRKLRTRWQTCHCDLHGENILVSTTDNNPSLIDFANVGEGPACLDPITLELSFLFHKSMGAENLEGWPPIENITSWRSTSSYLEGCPINNFIEQCRLWSEEAAAGDKEYLATIYAYLLRQFKYEDTNKELATALLNDVISKINDAYQR